jgi:heme exporter protein B
MSEISALLRKELLLEWRQKYAFNGILLYVLSTVFVCYLSFRQIIDIPTWNALFWIIQLFAGINAIAKSFISESRGRMLYYYSITSPVSLIGSKFIYNFLLMCILSFINLFFYTVFVGNPVQDMSMFILSMVLGSSGFSAILTMVSAIASKSGNSTTLMSILSFPILIPVLITTIRLSKNAIDGLSWSVSSSLMIILLSLNVLIVALGLVLFPYLWKD